jgi:hypothetical protein
MKINYRKENNELNTIDVNFLDMIKIFLVVSIVGTLLLWVCIFVIILIFAMIGGMIGLMF